MTSWPLQANLAQIPPDGPWRQWLFMGGRGAGKTRAGAEWVSAQIRAGKASRIALVGVTLSDVREVMIEGPSGLKNIGLEFDEPEYSVSRRRVCWPNGAEAYVFSSEDPDSLRGPQFDLAWCDEIAAWAYDETYDMLQLGLRLGDCPKLAATTTPRPVPLIKRIIEAPDTILTRASTRDNAENLASGFLAAMETAYGGSALGRQELLGELVEDREGALWRRSDIDGFRLKEIPPLDRIVIGLDPPASIGDRADACGIVGVGAIFEEGLKKQTSYYVLEDASVQGLRPQDWAGRAIALARQLDASEIIAEANQGGEMIRELLEMAGATPSSGIKIRLVHARKTKRARAEPVSALYDEGLVHHCGSFAQLEDEMCVFGSGSGRKSPDRLDALVWAIAGLTPATAPRFRVL